MKKKSLGYPACDCLKGSGNWVQEFRSILASFHQPLLFSFCWLTKVDGGFLPHWMDVYIHIHCVYI
jgi:hypothetical protein